MKKTSIALILALLLVLSACGGGDTPAPEETPEPAESETVQQEEPADEPAEEAQPTAGDSAVHATADQLKADIEMEDGMLKIESDRNAENAYPGITDLVEEYAIYLNATGGYAEEITVVKFKDGVTADQVQTLFEDRVAQQIINFEDYQPREMPKLEHPVMAMNESYGILVVAEDYQQAEGLVKDAIAGLGA